MRVTRIHPSHGLPDGLAPRPRRERVRHGRRLITTVARLPLSVAALAMFAAAPRARAALPPLIPRHVLFAARDNLLPQLSPDGTRIAWIAPARDSVPNVWVRTLGRTDDTLATHETHRPVARYAWSGDGRAILYLQDADGDEHWHLFAADLATGATRDLTPYPGHRAENLMVDPAHPGEVLIGLDLRDPRLTDMYRVNLATAAATLEAQNPGDVLSWTADAGFVIRACTALDSTDGSTVLRVRDRAGAPWRTLVRWGFEQAGIDRYRRIVGFARDGRSLYVQSPVGSNTTRLVRLSARDGRELETLARNPRCDLWNAWDDPETHVGALFDPRTGRPQAVAFEYLMREWHALDPAVAPDLRALAALGRGALDIEGRSRDDRLWLVSLSPDDGPRRYVLWRRDTRTAEPLFEPDHAFDGVTLARTDTVTFTARDGLPIPAYLTLPPGVPPTRLPLVLLTHGGPWFRDSWGGIDPDAQWLASRGYAVMQVQFRGSTGFGTRFLNASTHAMGVGGMQHDLDDAVDWAVGRGIADAARVALMGYSYGGYATLAGLAFTPGRYACGVEVCGPSDLKSLIESFPSWWAPRRRRWLLRIGDVVADTTLNRTLSPFFHADAIRSPLLVAQGARDPRVPLALSDALVRTLRAHRVDVQYLVYPDEGHGFGRPENAEDFHARAEAFLARVLGGRAEPAAPVPGSTAELR
jgi:dipeptidyl aminopeptidase/acylaminoacyl peptidase